MNLYIWLLSYVIFQVEGKCAKNYYYDGLLEDCQPCSIRCNSPPNTCTRYCSSIPENEAEKNQNVHYILIVFFVFLGAFVALTIILQVIRRKTCRPILIKQVIGGGQKMSVSENSSDITQQSEDPGEDMRDKRLDQLDHYNSSLPLPSTEEGTTLLVTTKTVQGYYCTPVI